MDHYTRLGLNSAISDIRDRISEKEKEVENFLRVKSFFVKAQKSQNRTGYGSIYEGYDLIYEGTLYGETTNYAFVGVKMAD